MSEKGYSYEPAGAPYAANAYKFKGPGLNQPFGEVVTAFSDLEARGLCRLFARAFEAGQKDLQQQVRSVIAAVGW